MLRTESGRPENGKRKEQLMLIICIDQSIQVKSSHKVSNFGGIIGSIENSLEDSIQLCVELKVVKQYFYFEFGFTVVRDSLSSLMKYKQILYIAFGASLNFGTSSLKLPSRFSYAQC